MDNEQHSSSNNKEVNVFGDFLEENDEFEERTTSSYPPQQFPPNRGHSIASQQRFPQHGSVDYLHNNSAPNSRPPFPPTMMAPPMFHQPNSATGGSYNLAPPPIMARSYSPAASAPFPPMMMAPPMFHQPNSAMGGSYNLAPPPIMARPYSPAASAPFPPTMMTPPMSHQHNLSPQTRPQQFVQPVPEVPINDHQNFDTFIHIETNFDITAEYRFLVREQEAAQIKKQFEIMYSDYKDKSIGDHIPGFYLKRKDSPEGFSTFTINIDNRNNFHARDVAIKFGHFLIENRKEFLVLVNEPKKAKFNIGLNSIPQYIFMGSNKNLEDHREFHGKFNSLISKNNEYIFKVTQLELGKIMGGFNNNRDFGFNALNIQRFNNQIPGMNTQFKAEGDFRYIKIDATNSKPHDAKIIAKAFGHYLLEFDHSFTLQNNANQNLFTFSASNASAKRNNAASTSNTSAKQNNTAQANFFKPEKSSKKEFKYELPGKIIMELISEFIKTKAFNDTKIFPSSITNNVDGIVIQDIGTNKRFVNLIFTGKNAEVLNSAFQECKSYILAKILFNIFSKEMTELDNSMNKVSLLSSFKSLFNASTVDFSAPFAETNTKDPFETLKIKIKAGLSTIGSSGEGCKVSVYVSLLEAVYNTLKACLSPEVFDDLPKEKQDLCKRWSRLIECVEKYFAQNNQYVSSSSYTLNPTLRAKES